MARSDARLVRFGVFAGLVLIALFILLRGLLTVVLGVPLAAAAPKSPAAARPAKNPAAGLNPGAIHKGKTAGTYKPLSDGLLNKEPVLLGNGNWLVEKATTPPGTRLKATFVSLARNQDLWLLVGLIRHVQDRFNSKFNYDWVFLNDEEFSDEFKEVTSSLVSGNTKYGLIPKLQWSFPEWIDVEKAAKVREEMREKKIIYGDLILYRHMCRYELGFFWRHDLMMDYDWYWRVEPDIKIYCDIDYDIFKFMEDNDKAYGFTISLPEYKETITTLWDETKKFIKAHPEFVPKDNMMDWVSDDGGSLYNGCHFWLNFEVASLKFWRSEAYTKYFEHLDQAGGFFYERWGDAPVHLIAAALFLPRDKIHFFGDVGYYHVPFHNCPTEKALRLERNCVCEMKEDFTWKGWSCTPKFFSVNGMERPKGWQDYT